MVIQQSERAFRDVESRDLNLNWRTATVPSTLTSASFGKERIKRVGVVLLGAAFVGGAASLPALGNEGTVSDEPAAVAAVEEQKKVEENVFLYQMKTDGATITGVRDRTATTLVIPATIDGVDVTKVGKSAFEGLKNLESLTWESSAYCKIEPRAFANCPALKRVVLPEKLYVIPEFAFVGCGALESVSGENVRTIGERAFAGCKSLETLEFDDVYTVGFWAFVGCDKLAKFDFVSPKNKTLQLVDGLLLSKDGKTLYACSPGRTGEVVVPDGVASIAKGAFQGGEIESVVLPRTLEIIDANAFESCMKLKSVLSAPEALETIGASAFSGCSALERFDWPENLQVIGKNAFTNCDSLTSAEIKSVRRVGENAFYNNNKLATVELPSGTREIEAGAFAETALTTFKLPRDLETLQPGAFSGVALEKIEIEEGNVAFKIVDGALLSADGKTLYFRLPATSETTWKIPDGVRVVARSAFWGNKSLVSLEIPEGVETIGQNAFYECSALQKLTIPASLREIDANFASCSALSTFEVADENPNYRSVDGSLVSKDGKTLYRLGGNGVERRVVPNGVERLTAWSCAGDWSCVEIAPTVKRIDATAFGNPENLTAIKIPASVERLDERFVYCPKLTTFEVAPENPVYKSENGALLSKDGKTFYRLVENLRTADQKRFMSPEEEKKGVEYVIPEGVETIVGHAFVNRDEITKVVLPQSLKKIAKSAFSGCSYYFTSVAIPAGVTTIEPGAFFGCNLREVVLESSKANFPPEAFARPSYSTREDLVVRVDEKVIAKEAAELAARKAREEALSWRNDERDGATLAGVRDRNATTLEIPETLGGLPVRSIAPEAFVGMTALKTVRIPASLQTIGRQAFEGCASLEKIEFITPEKSRLRQIDASAFKGCSSLKTFEAPDVLGVVGAWAFAECSALETVKLGRGAHHIGDSAFRDCVSLRSVEFPENAMQVWSGGALYVGAFAFGG
ncbi:MAG: leucine-rich repeat domain-containing protein, partial [Thermoguttaceae bacterium]|nr:leucine-rich repeat domain-containing protein [Thermoguttaceae bacterium]